MTCLSEAAIPLFDEGAAWQLPGGLPTGAFAPIEVRMVIQMLRTARMARPELLRATCTFARLAGNWDAKLRRLMCRVHATKKLMQTW